MSPYALPIQVLAISGYQISDQNIEPSQDCDSDELLFIYLLHIKANQSLLNKFTRKYLLLFGPLPLHSSP